MYLSLAKSYVYKLVHKTTGQFYYGSRKENVKFNRQAKDDLGIYYFSSSKTIKEMGFENFHFEIIGEYDNFDDAYRTEHQLIKESFYNPLNLNKHLVDVENGKKHFCHAKEQSEEAIIKIREKRAKQVISDETRKRMSESHARRSCLKIKQNDNKEKKIRKQPLIYLSHTEIENLKQSKEILWFNINGTKEFCSKKHLCEKYGLNQKNISNLIAGRKRTMNGWAVSLENSKTRFIDNKRFASFDSTIYHWKNIDGREEWLTQYDMRVKYSYKSSNISALVKKREKSFKGWSIVWN